MYMHCYKHGTNNFHCQLTSYSYHLVRLTVVGLITTTIVCGTGNLRGFLLKYIFTSMVDANDGNLANYNGPN